MRILFASFSLAFLVFVDWAARAAHDPQVPSVVTTRVTGAGMFFGDAKGMTLYTYARDITPGISACVEACAKLWPPLMAAADAVESGEWTIISRDEGERQRTHILVVRLATGWAQHGMLPLIQSCFRPASLFAPCM